MGKMNDFLTSFDYEGFFTNLTMRIEEGQYEKSGDRHFITVDCDGCPVEIENRPFDSITLSGSIAAEDPDAFCIDNNGRFGHVVFHAADRRLNFHASMPLVLGTGWDDLIIEEAATALEEIRDFLAEYNS